MSQPSWEQRLADVVELTQIMSRQLDPQKMVREYSGRVRKMFPVDRWMSLSRRDLEYPNYRITRYSGWTEEINPWKQRDRLPLLSGGLLAELIYSNHPRIIDVLEFDPADPAAPYLDGQGSLMAIPMLDGGEALNMAINLNQRTHGFEYERFPDTVWLSNLFGRATHNLVLREEVLTAYRAVERELKVVGDIQRSLLPKELPEMPGLELAVYYQTSQQAGGDYYDFFPLAEGKWGILIADVSGHGTPAAVMMAITHSIAHLYPNDPGTPSGLLEFVNSHLAGRYAADSDTFVTAFYGIYDPKARVLNYSSAGHNPPRLWKCREQVALGLDAASSMPLGLSTETRYGDAVVELTPGDRLVFYTDGITESVGADGRQFGTKRVDTILARSCRQAPGEIVEAILQELAEFTDSTAPADDRSLVVARVM
jgi:sigma-B regulation protein RsbU (phosphoserine phosphatase)